MLLNEQEIDDLSREMVKGCKSVNWLAQKIESAVLEKLKAQEPEAYKFSAPGITKLDSWPHGGKWYPLYRHPLPPDDVVRDAERYRWLRERMDTKDVSIFRMRTDFGVEEWNENVDAAIDAAMKKMK